MSQAIYSPKIIPPTSRYSHGVVVGANAHTLYASGQISVAPDGTCSEDFRAQARQCWSNLMEVLKIASMEMEHLVRVQAYVTDARYLQDYRDIRNEFVGEFRPAHTLLVVAALGMPEWKVEIEGIAARVQE